MTLFAAGGTVLGVMQVPTRVAEVLERLQRTRWQYYNLHPASGEVLALLARVARPQRVVEVGTSNGYSAIVLGAAVQEREGQVFTIERDGEIAEEARANIAEASLQDIVTVVPGSAFKVLKELEGPWDLAFLDATKQEYVGYLDRLLPKLAPRALLVADNVLSHADELQEFTARIHADPRLDATILPVGTGLLVGIYEGGPERDTAAEAVAERAMPSSLGERVRAVVPGLTRARAARR